VDGSILVEKFLQKFKRRIYSKIRLSFLMTFLTLPGQGQLLQPWHNFSQTLSNGVPARPWMPLR